MPAVTVTDVILQDFWQLESDFDQTQELALVKAAAGFHPGVCRKEHRGGEKMEM